eukprot:Rhum_TRINITY_DN7849_c0_g1::Rhum_TRINITY_DN7849_c0_g1_i1::g.24723::m.24723
MRLPKRRSTRQVLLLLDVLQRGRPVLQRLLRPLPLEGTPQRVAYGGRHERERVVVVGAAAGDRSNVQVRRCRLLRTQLRRRVRRVPDAQRALHARLRRAGAGEGGQRRRRRLCRRRNVAAWRRVLLHSNSSGSSGGRALTVRLRRPTTHAAQRVLDGAYEAGEVETVCEAVHLGDDRVALLDEELLAPQVLQEVLKGLPAVVQEEAAVGVQGDGRRLLEELCQRRAGIGGEGGEAGGEVGAADVQLDDVAVERGHQALTPPYAVAQRTLLDLEQPPLRLQLPALGLQLLAVLLEGFKIVCHRRPDCLYMAQDIQLAAFHRLFWCDVGARVLVWAGVESLLLLLAELAERFRQRGRGEGGKGV